MFCPRCGRPVSLTANFCGGCGLPRAEIEKSFAQQQSQMQTPEIQPAPQITPAEIEDVHSIISKLEENINDTDSVVNYTTDTDVNTNTESKNTRDIAQEIKLTVENQFESSTQQPEIEQNARYGQSAYSYNAPQYPYYDAVHQNEFIPEKEEVTVDQNLTTVDFIWMMLISGLPLIGIIYVIYQAFIQKENVNKRSWAKATIIIAVFSFILAFAFAMGIIIPQMMYW